jgi:vacuolar-type H+-ATPase subunit C/Vma6
LPKSFSRGSNAIFANAAITGLSSKLLSKHQERRIAAAATFEDAARVLFECGYDENTILHASDNEDYIIRNETIKTMELFLRLCPDAYLRDCVSAEYNFHNAKVVYKSQFTKIDLDSAAYPFGTEDIEKLQNAVKYKDYSKLPHNIKYAFLALDKKTNPTASEIDTEFAHAYDLEIQENAKQIKSKNIADCFLQTDKKSDFSMQVSVFSLEFLFNWFMLKQAELSTVKTLLMSKKLGIKGRWWEQAK